MDKKEVNLQCDIFKSKRFWVRTNTWQLGKVKTIEVFWFVRPTRHLYRFRFAIWRYGIDLVFDPFLGQILLEVGRRYFDYRPFELWFERGTAKHLKSWKTH